MMNQAINSLKIGFQGIAGAYSEKAALAYFHNKDYCLKASTTFSSLFNSLMTDEIDLAVVPIENSLAGSIHENYDHLLNNDVWIRGEIKIPIDHSLIGMKDVRLEEITHVYSHPQALSQCGQFLNSLMIEKCPYFDTAGSVEFIAKEKNRHFAAIAGEHAARDYGLSVLKKSIQDDHTNTTRFFIVEKLTVNSASTQSIEATKNAKTSLVFALKNVPGALHKALSIFAIRDIDLTKIESRPLRSTPWKYYFYLDIDGSFEEAKVKKAIDHLSEITHFLKVIGSYGSDITEARKE